MPFSADVAVRADRRVEPLPSRPARRFFVQ
jgi:hypothetical protein